MVPLEHRTFPTSTNYRYDDEPWDGNYSSNDMQMVRAEDANALADALERAMEDVSDQEIEAEITGRGGRRRLKELVDFCRKGEFAIC